MSIQSYLRRVIGNVVLLNLSVMTVQPSYLLEVGAKSPGIAAEVLQEVMRVR